MRNFLKIKRLLKLAQEGNLEAWQAVKAEVESEELPAGIIDVAAIEAAGQAASNFMEKAKEAKAAADTMSDEDKKQLASSVRDPNFWQMAETASGGSTVTASGLIDALFVKSASHHVTKSEALEIIREINLYKNLKGIEIKIASRNDLMKSFLEKEEAFNRMCEDRDFLIGSSLFRISSKYSKDLIKRADAGSSIWSSVKNFGSKALEVGLTSLRHPLKFLGTVLPFVGLILNAKYAYEAYQNVDKALKGIESKFSDFGSEDQLTDSEHIKSLIEKFSNDPEQLLRVAQLNKVAKFYIHNWYDQWFNLAMFISDLLFSIGIVVTAAGTGGLSAAIMLPLQSMLKGIFLRAATWGGLSGAAGSIGMKWFDIGLGDFVDNNEHIKHIADVNLKNMSQEGTLQPADGMQLTKEEEEALLEFQRLGDSLSAG